MTDFKHIAEHVNRFFDGAKDYQRKLDILCGSVADEMVESLEKVIKSKTAHDQLQARLVPINLVSMINDRISRVYQSAVARTAHEDDQGFIDHIESQGLNATLAYANKIFNLHGFVGLEPYIKGGKIRLRVLDGTSLCPYSDSKLDPNQPTHLVKWLDTAKDADGEFRVYQVCDAQTVTTITSRGDVLDTVDHNLGRSPVLFISRNPYRLVPALNLDDLKLSLSVSNKLTDLNFATLYASHSIIYTVDMDMANAEFNPDSVIAFKSVDGGPDKSSPSVGTLQPKVDIAGVLSLIGEEISIFLRSIGVTAAQAIGDSPASAASGIAKTIDDSDAKQVVLAQQVQFKQAEESELWPLLAAFHSQSGAASSYPKGLPADFEVSVSFPEKKPSESHTAIVQRQKLMLDAGLTSHRRAVAAANSDLTDGQITELIKEIEAEKSYAPAENHVENPQGAEPQPEGSSS